MLSKPTSLQFLQQINLKKCHVHPVNGAGIQTHDLFSHNHWTRAPALIQRNVRAQSLDLLLFLTMCQFRPLLCLEFKPRATQHGRYIQMDLGMEAPD